MFWHLPRSVGSSAISAAWQGRSVVLKMRAEHRYSILPLCMIGTPPIILRRKASRAAINPIRKQRHSHCGATSLYTDGVARTKDLASPMPPLTTCRYCLGPALIM